MYRLRILVKGIPIPVYNDDEGNCWVEARKGNDFEIKVKPFNTKFLEVVFDVSKDIIIKTFKDSRCLRDLNKQNLDNINIEYDSILNIIKKVIEIK